MSETFATRYAALIAAGEIEVDAGQALLARRIAELARRLDRRRLAQKSSSLGWLFGRRDPAAPLKGLYIYGEVGRGKTMLMDVFFTTSPVMRKRRAHFHEFMTDVHERVHAFRQDGNNGENRIRRAVAATGEEASCSASTNFMSPTSPTP